MEFAYAESLHFKQLWITEENLTFCLHGGTNLLRTEVPEEHEAKPLAELFQL